MTHYREQWKGFFLKQLTYRGKQHNRLHLILSCILTIPPDECTGETILDEMMTRTRIQLCGNEILTIISRIESLIPDFFADVPPDAKGCRDKKRAVVHAARIIRLGWNVLQEVLSAEEDGETNEYPLPSK